MFTCQRGDTTELLVCARLTEKGFSISRPVGNNLRYDLIADYKGKLYRIQVKTSRQSKNSKSITFKTVSSHISTQGHAVRRRYDSTQIDLFATTWNDQAYLIPVEETGRSEFIMRFEWAKNDQVKGVHFLENYTIDKFLKKIKGDSNAIQKRIKK